ncbi:MAG: bifunctional folylpolyglutamate synthase/dihydrofolate synthase [Pseudomonadota bacterium]|nr:bifunctional folylpolyglutamate synthase/dihydrofolate synthase [Pseudomonadota bacterium]
MAMSDAILTRLLAGHPKVIDLSLDRMWRILARIGNPERRLPPVVHVAGTNGKGSTVACLRAILEASGLRVHAYTSPHLIRFHERIRLASGPGASEFISEPALAAVLEECERANGGAPVTFFEITTAAALLTFERLPADYLLLEVGLGGRLDATNVVDRPKLSIITTVDYDHQKYLGDSLALIAREKAGILKAGVPAVIAQQPAEALAAIKQVAADQGSPLSIAGEDWLAFEQQARLVYQDGDVLLDLPRPKLHGRFQIDNAGLAIAAIRKLADRRIGEEAMAEGLRKVDWPARMQRLEAGLLTTLAGGGGELWLDGGHNPSGGAALAHSLAELEQRAPRALVIVWGMLNTKDARAFIRPFKGLARAVVALTIPGEPNAMAADALVQLARSEGIDAEPAASIEDAVGKAASGTESARIVITGSLYLAGRVLALHRGETMSAVSGTARP